MTDSQPLHPADALRLQRRQEYAELYAEAHRYWTETQCTGADISAKFGVHALTGPRWVQEWQALA